MLCPIFYGRVVPAAVIHGTTQDSLDHKGRCGAAPGRRRHNRLVTATPMLNAVAVVANHACSRHQPSFLASRRLRRISRAKAFLRGLNSLGSRLLRLSMDQPSRPSVSSTANALNRSLLANLPDRERIDLALTSPQSTHRYVWSSVSG